MPRVSGSRPGRRVAGAMPNPFGQMSLRATGGSGNPYGGHGGTGFNPANSGIPPMLLSGFGQVVNPGHHGLAVSDAFADMQGVGAPMSDHERLAALVGNPLAPHQPPRADPGADASTYYSGRKIVNNVVTRISTPYSTGPLPCPYGCGRSFKHATQKAIHVRKAHTGERPFVCAHEGCARAFHSSGDLKSHEKTHSGAREHVCGTCGKALSSRNALKVHERALHTLDRPFKCEVPECGMTYMTRLDLDRHAAKHAKNKAREEKAKLSQLEKRASRAERQVKLLREKQGKLEKKERKMQAAVRGSTMLGGGMNEMTQSGGRSAYGASVLSPAEIADALDFCAKSVGAIADLTPVPPPGAVAYLVLTNDGGGVHATVDGDGEGGAANDRDGDGDGDGDPPDPPDPLDDLVVVRRRDVTAALAARASARRGVSARSSLGAGEKTSSHLTSTVGSDGGAGGDPTVQGVFAARDALAKSREAASGESDDDQPLAALVRDGGGGGGGAGVKRARADDVSEGKGGKVSKRRVLERLLREAYGAATTRGAVPFQSWRRGLPKAEAERLEALAEAEAGQAGA